MSESGTTEPESMDSVLLKLFHSDSDPYNLP